MSGCASSYSPNTYSSNAVQLANVVDAGIVAGYREVKISANGNIGAVTGGAAGGLLGAQYAGALAAVGATAVGLMAGSAIDHAAGDTTGWEYIICKHDGNMVSVTQREKTPLALGQKVLVIMGPQARVVADYSSTAEQPPPAASRAKAEPKPDAPVKVELVLSLAPGMAAQLASSQTSGQTPAAQSSFDGEVSKEAMADGELNAIMDALDKAPEGDTIFQN